MPKILIIIPAHNEELNIATVIREIQQYYSGFDILVINDGSTDRTASIANEMGVELIDLPFNLGYGGAVQTGFKYATENKYDIAVLLDGDGQHDPRYVKKMLKPIENGQADVVIGSRFHKDMRGEFPLPFTKKLGIKLFSSIVNKITGQKYTDPTSGFQALNRKVLFFFSRDNYPTDYPDADTILLLNFAGFHVTEVPVQMRERKFGKSMHNSFTIIYYIYKMFLSLFILTLRKKSIIGMHYNEPAT